MNKKLEKAKFFYSKGKLLKAKDLCLSLCKVKSIDPECHLLLANIYLKTDSYSLAVKYYQLVLQRDIQSVDALAGIGTANLALGENDKAFEYFNASLNKQPANIESKIGLSDICFINKQYSRSENYISAVLKAQPENIDAIYRMGKLRLAINKPDQAIKYYNHVLKISPKHQLANLDLARIYQSRGYIEESVGLLKKVLKSSEAELDLFLELGHLLIVLDRCEEAVGVFNKALKSDADSPELAAGLATALGRLGRKEEALSKITPFIKNNIKNPLIAKSYIKLVENIDDEFLRYVNNALDDSEISGHDKAEIYFPLGDLYDKNKIYDKAFEYYELANNHRANNHRGNTYSHAEFSASIDAIINVFSQNQFSKMPRASVDKNKRPVFIVGMPRSGTSLVEQILSSHHNVYGAGELRVIGDELNKISSESGQYPQCMTNISKESIENAAKNYTEYLNKISSSETFVTDKMPHNFMHLGFIALMFPEARIIHCKRNPRDTCLSIYFQNFHKSHAYATDFKNIISHYNDYNKIMNHWKLVLGLPVFEIEYETLVNDQQISTKKLLEFIGLEWDEQCMRFYENKRSVATNSHDQVTKKIYTGSMQRWKNYKNYIDEICKSNHI